MKLKDLLEGKSDFSVSEVKDGDDNAAVVVVKHKDGRTFNVSFPEDLSEPIINGDKFATNEEQDILSVATPAVERG